MENIKLETYFDLKNKTITESNAIIDDINRKIKQYEDLRSNMVDLRSKSHIEAMVPVNKIAFFRGKLRHSNDITVFLGDGYFVERTVDECKGIINRRIQLLSKTKQEYEEILNKETNMVQHAHMQFKHELDQGKKEKELEGMQSYWNDDGTFEIREELNEDYEQQEKEQTANRNTGSCLFKEEFETDRTYDQKVPKPSDFIAKKKAMADALSKLSLESGSNSKHAHFSPSTVDSEPQIETEIPPKVVKNDRDTLVDINECNSSISQSINQGSSSDLPKKISKFKQRQMMNKNKSISQNSIKF